MSSWAQCARGGDHGAGRGGFIFPTNPTWKSVWSHHRVAQGCLTPKKENIRIFFMVCCIIHLLVAHSQTDLTDHQHPTENTNIFVTCSVVTSVLH